MHMPEHHPIILKRRKQTNHPWCLVLQMALSNNAITTSKVHGKSMNPNAHYHPVSHCTNVSSLSHIELYRHWTCCHSMHVRTEIIPWIDGPMQSWWHGKVHLASPCKLVDDFYLPWRSSMHCVSPRQAGGGQVIESVSVWHGWWFGWDEWKCKWIQIQYRGSWLAWDSGGTQQIIVLAGK